MVHHRTVNVLHRLIIVVIVVVSLMIVGVGGIGIVHSQNNASITVVTEAQGKTGDAVKVPGKDISTVTIRLSGGQCPAVKRTIPVDVALVIDISGSMQDPTSDGLTKLNATKQAAKEFVTRFNLNSADTNNSDQVAIISFAYRFASGDSDAKVNVPLSRSRNELINAIDNLAVITDGNYIPGTGTFIDGGLVSAANELASTRHNFTNNAVPVIVLLSDGGSSDSDATRAEAEHARSLSGARIITIGLGQPGDPNTNNNSGVDRKLLTALADGGDYNNPDNPNDDAYFAESYKDLRTVYDTVAAAIQPRVVAKDVSLTYTLDTSKYALMPGSVNPPAQQQNGATSTNSITWNLSELLSSGKQEFQFDVQALSAGTFPVGTGSILYTPCSETAPRTDSFAGPNVVTLLPTATPTPTSTPTPTATATPTVTPLPTLSSLLRTPVPGLVKPTSGPGVTTDFCEQGWWDFVPWLVALLILLASLYYLWRYAKNNPGWMWSLCFWARALPLLWLVLVAFLFIRPVKGVFCQPRESVYFWRMSNNGSGISSGIFLTYANLPEDQAPAQVTNLNQQGCVGCHTTSTKNGLLAATYGPLPGSLVVIKLDGTTVTVPKIDSVFSAFSPDGNKLAVSTSKGDIYILDLTAAVIQPQLLNGASDGTFAAVMPAWSSDGKTIAFARAPRSQIDVAGAALVGTSSLYTIPSTGGSPQEITGASAPNTLNYYPNFSPDGKWLAFTRSTDGKTYSSPASDIWLLNLQTGQARPLSANSPNHSDSWPSWSLDSKQLAFNTTQFDSNYDIVIANVNPDGSTSAALPLAGASEQGTFEHLPYWGTPVKMVSITDQWKALWPWLLPFIPFAILLLVCLLPRKKPKMPEIVVPPSQPAPKPLKIRDLPPWTGVEVLWKARPALIIGLGEPGFQVLSQLKKTLADATLGKTDDKVNLLSITDSSKEYIPAPGGKELDDAEMLMWRDPLKALLDQAKDDIALKEWINPDYLKTLGDVTDPRTGFKGLRAIARAAVVNNLRGDTRETKVSLWEQLQSLARKSLDDNRLNVIIVSSTADDIGSGSFIDLAYITHLLEKKLNLSGVRVIGHLLTDRAMQSVGTNQYSANTSTAAALRELTRFQLSASVNTPMDYRRSDGDSPTELDGNWTRLIFDELYLHDGEGGSYLLKDSDPTPMKINQVAPELGIYPALADSIALWLDTAARRADLASWRDPLVSGAMSVQTLEQKLMVSGFGIYQYRLPFADLLEDITVRFAREVLQILMMGESKDRPTLSTNFNREVFVSRSSDPATIAQAMLMGELGAPTELDINWRTLFKGIAEQNRTSIETALRNIRADAARDTKGWQEWLYKTVTFLLNGRDIGPDNLDIVNRRGGKIGFVYLFLDALSHQITLGAQQIEQLEIGKDNPAVESLNSFAKDTTTFAAKLKSVAESLGTGPSLATLYARLASRDTRIAQRWRDLTNLATRQYILNDAKGRPLRDVWFDRYILNYKLPDGTAVNSIVDALFQLGWVIRDGVPKLRLQLPDLQHEDGRIEARSLEFDPTKVSQFEEALLELGRYYVRTIRDNENLREILRADLLQPEKIGNTAQLLRQKSGALLGIRQTSAPRMDVGMILSANRGIEEAIDLQQETIKYLKSANRLKRLETTDPFSLTLAQTVDYVPLDAVTSVEQAFTNYNSELGISERAPNARVLPLPSAYQAEASALYYERQMYKVSRQIRLSPVTVAGLTSRAKAEVYLLAAVIGDSPAQPGELRYTPLGARRGMIYSANEVGEIELLDSNNVRVSAYGDLMQGLLNFIKDPRITESATMRILRRYELADEIYALWDQFDQQEGKAWELYNNPEQPFSTQINSELALVARLIIQRIVS